MADYAWKIEGIFNFTICTNHAQCFNLQTDQRLKSEKYSAKIYMKNRNNNRIKIKIFVSSISSEVVALWSYKRLYTRSINASSRHNESLKILGKLDVTVTIILYRFIDLHSIFLTYKVCVNVCYVLWHSRVRRQ